jgi:hypothetical protein
LLPSQSSHPEYRSSAPQLAARYQPRPAPPLDRIHLIPHQ